MRNESRTRRRRLPASRRRQAGFSFVEIVAVVLILGLMFAILMPNLEQLSPKYSLRAGAREIGSMIEEANGRSIGLRRSFAIAYDLDERWAAIVLPPGWGEDGGGFDADDEEGAPTGDQETDFGSREMLAPHYLPLNVDFKSVVLPGDQEQASAGRIYVGFSPYGTDGSHIVHLVNIEDSVVAIEFHAMAGSIHYENAERSFEEFSRPERDFSQFLSQPK